MIWLAAVLVLAGEPTDASPLRVVYSGGTGGVGSGSYHFHTPELLGDAVEGATVTHGALVQGPFTLVPEDARVHTALAALEAGRCTPAGPVWVHPQHAEVVIAATGAPWIADLPIAEGATAGEVASARCEAGGSTALLVGPADASPVWDVGTWEFRLGLRVEVGDDVAWVVGVPRFDGARRAGALAAALADPAALFVDAGDFLDGASSVQDAALSLHRSTALALLRRLGPDALAPGRNELVGGARRFRADTHDLPYVAANWRTDDRDLALPSHRVARVGDRRVAIVGTVDPALAPLVAPDGVRIVDPVAAVAEVVSELDADVVIVLGDGEHARDLARLGVGIDLVIGDREARLAGAERLTWALGLPDEGAAHGLLLPSGGAFVATLREGDAGGPGEVAVAPLSGPVDVAPDPAVRTAISEVRAEQYPGYDAALVPELDDDAWPALVCAAVREATDADLVFLPDLPIDVRLPAALTELQVADRMARLDRLEVHRVPGDRLERLVQQAAGHVPTACGTTLGAKTPKVRGRPVDVLQTYRLVTTDQLLVDDPALAGLVSGATFRRPLDAPSSAPVRDDTGRLLTLRRATLSTLREWRDARGLAAMAESSDAGMPRLWRLSVQRLSGRVERFRGAEDPAFAAVPETLATSASSFTVGADVDSTLDYSSRGVAVDARVLLAYARLQTAEGAQETADDLQLSTSVTAAGVALALGPLKLAPFGEVRLDSEVTAGEGAARQQDLYLQGGLSASVWGPLKRLRLMGFALRDLAVPDKALEGGGRVDAQTVVALAPALSWSTSADLTVFGGTRDDDESDLRLRLLADTRFTLPVLRWLGASVYGQAFVFSGAVPATGKVRASTTLGVSLDVRGAWRLN